MLPATPFQILRACYEYWETEPLPPAERVVCYSWVEPLCRRLFGTTLHQSAMDQLARQGHLTKAETSRGGARRYYRLNHPERWAPVAPSAVEVK